MMGRTVAVAALSLLLIWTGVVSSADSPPQVQPPPHENNWTGAYQQKPKQAKGDPDKRPSIFNVFTAEGLETISSYCTSSPNNEPDKWLHEKFICDIRVTDIAIAVFSGLLVVVTIGLIVVGAAQWWLSRTTARQELRAYMGVDNVHILFGETFVSPARGVFVIRNFGKTMAKDTEIWINGIMMDGNPHEFQWGNRQIKTVVMPNEALGFEHDIISPKDRKGSIYLWGRIIYYDVFKKRHWTEFRFINRSEVVNFDGALGWKTTHCDEGNDAT